MNHQHAARSIDLVVGALVICLALAGIAQAQETFTARLTMMPVDEVNRGIVTGSGSATATLDGRVLSLDGSFTGLRGPATDARLHESLETGVRGAALFVLTIRAAVDGTFSGEVELSRDQVQMLRDGHLYIQIHSQSAPEGNLWGWLLQ